MRYLTRQVAVDAIQWDGKEDTFGAIRDMLGDEYELEYLDEVEGILQLDTSTGTAWPMKDDWIVWDGENAYAYKDEQFKMLFDPGKDYYRLPYITARPLTSDDLAAMTAKITARAKETRA